MSGSNIEFCKSLSEKRGVLSFSQLSAQASYRALLLSHTTSPGQHSGLAAAAEGRATFSELRSLSWESDDGIGPLEPHKAHGSQTAFLVLELLELSGAADTA